MDYLSHKPDIRIGHEFRKLIGRLSRIVSRMLELQGKKIPDKYSEKIPILFQAGNNEQLKRKIDDITKPTFDPYDRLRVYRILMQ